LIEVGCGRRNVGGVQSNNQIVLKKKKRQRFVGSRLYLKARQRGLPIVDKDGGSLADGFSWLPACRGAFAGVGVNPTIVRAYCTTCYLRHIRYST
jgi:hypothetical protein